jgi:pimeloyl-ACP methyl ester carboxylesterase
MQMKVHGVNINYTRYGKEDAKTIVYLHGWGQNIEMMKPIADPFSDEFNILILDLPGFGASDEPDSVWTCYDYIDCIHEMLEKLHIEKPIVIGHSFGGKLSLMYAAKYETEKVVVFASPFKKEIEKISFKTKVLKKLKTVPGINKLEGFAKKHIGSTDYRNSSEMMRKIMVEHVNLDITDEVKNIKCPTLIVWGTMDQAVPVERAFELEKLIKDSGTVIYEGCTHYAYLERLNQTINVLWNFL